jgi:pimeloyl-ACP methyl ester carboxylesterase
MNAFIFGFHPAGSSMERCLAEAGFEVWSVNLRGQGRSRRSRPDAPGPTLLSYVQRDLPAALDALFAATRSSARRASLIGCSLGGSLLYAYLALYPDAPVGALCTIGAPLRWTTLHPALKLAFSSPALLGKLRLSGTRRLASLSLGLLTRFPSLLSIYMNADHVDLSAAQRLVQAVEDPHPAVNQDIAAWIRARDLILARVNVTEAMREVPHPLLLVVSNRDGIVPSDAALSARAAWGGPDVEVLHVGDESEWYAHADLFIARKAPEHVFHPIARWLHKYP